jgi:hypothetical protein
MVSLLRVAKRSGARAFYYVAAYWMLNIALVVAEARWHLIYKLTLWDIAELRSLGPLFSHLAHH